MAPGTFSIFNLPTATPLPLHLPLSLKSPQLTNHPVPISTQPIIISGPSGVGKGTLYKLLLERHPSVFATSISHTTRDPRPGEQRDVDYYYVSMEEFEKKIGENAFVEHAKFGGNRYGTSKAMIEDFMGRGRIVVLDIEMEVRFTSLRILYSVG
jgi:guanylate kinase